jgi:integrase
VRKLRVTPNSPVAIYLLGLSPGSRATQVSAIRDACRAFQIEPARVVWPEITHEQLVMLRAYVAERYRPATANRILTAVRSVLDVCVHRGELSYDRFRRVTAVKPVRGARVRAGRALDPHEIEAIFRWCATAGVRGTHHAALVAVLYGAGLRRRELVGLDLADFDAAAATMRVMGKGNKERMQPLPRDVVRALESWLRVRGPDPGPLFWSLQRWTHKPQRGERLKYSRIPTILGQIARAAGVPSFTPHDMRRTWIGELLELTDLATAQQLADHADPQTTAGYDRRPLRKRAAAAAMIRIPGIA